MWLQNGYSYQVALDSRRRPMIEWAQRKEEHAGKGNAH